MRRGRKQGHGVPGAERIVVRNAQRKIGLDRESLADFASQAFNICQEVTRRKAASANEICVVLVSDNKIAEIHRQFMSIEGPTDVITFQHGEIVISVETALRQAREYRTSIEQELRLYIVHGFLHLLGFDDITAAGRREMARVQERVLREAG